MNSRMNSRMKSPRRLLGINVGLLTMKPEARSNLKGFKNEIASMQRLAVKSARSVRRFAREINVRQPAPNKAVRHETLKR